MPDPSNEPLRQAVAAWRAAQKADSDADAAKAAGEQRVAEVKASLNEAVADLDALGKAKAATTKTVADAAKSVAAKLEPAVPWSEDGTTVLVNDGRGNLREVPVNYLSGRPAK